MPGGPVTQQDGGEAEQRHPVKQAETPEQLVDRKRRPVERQHHY